MSVFLLTLVTAANGLLRAEATEAMFTSSAEAVQKYSRASIKSAQESFEPMSLEHAMHKVNVPHHIQGMLHKQKLSLRAGKGRVDHEVNKLHAEAQKAEDEPNALDKAKDTLNAMMEGTEEELDTALTECKAFDFETTSNLNENSVLRSDTAEEVAEARAEIGDATLTINEATINLDAVRQAAHDAAMQCAASKAASEEQIALLEADLQVGIMILNMTNCQDADSTTDTTLLQCGSGGSRQYHFKGTAMLSKKFKTAAANNAMKRAARMMLGKPARMRSYVKVNGRRVAMKTTTKQMKRNDSEVGPSEDERMAPPDEEDLEDLDSLEVAAMPPPPEYGTDVDISKCSVGGSPACPMIRDSLSGLVAEIRWAKDQAEAALAASEAECARLANDYRMDDQKYTLTLEGAGAKFARATGAVNLGEEKLRMKIGEANELIAQLTEHRLDCGKKIKEGAETLCGIKTIRQELYTMAGEWPAFQDCEVNDWLEEACSQTCGGGSKTLSRGIVVPADGGAACPPLTEMEQCGAMPCPIDCIPGDWSGWSACSKDCGNGIMQRSRPKAQEEQHGGTGCGDLVDSEACNVDACDIPCTLGDWGEWSVCSRACDGGEIVRFRDIATPAGPTGPCWEATDPMRMHVMDCNMGTCPGDLTCTDELDLVILVDGSGSIEFDEEEDEIRGTPESSGGWLKEKHLATLLASQLTFGETMTKAGVVLFSWQVDTISELTFDKAALETAVADMTWPGWNTDTSGALARAGNMLMTGGRGHIPKEKSVVLLITDGDPNDMSNANAAAEKLKETARLVVVPIGGYINMDAVNRWASFPSSQNVIAAESFDDLQNKLGEMMASVCNRLECSEAMTGRGQDYLGCQTATRSGWNCQVWTAQSPHSHGYLPWNYPDGHIGDHNYCRNPDGDSTIWCITDTDQRWWEFCDIRETSDIPEYTPT